MEVSQYTVAMRIVFYALAFLAGLSLHADELVPLALRQVKAGGEIGRRVDVTLHNNLLVLDVERDFLAPLAAREPKSGYIGLGKLLMSAVRLAAYSSNAEALAIKDRVVSRVLASQEPDGYLGFFLPANRLVKLWDIHEMGYLIAGLTDNYVFFNHKPSLAAAARAADYIVANWNKLPANWGSESGVAANVAATGLERAMIALARASGNQRYLDFVNGPRALGEWNLPIVIGRRPGIEGHVYHYMARSLAQLELYRTNPHPRLLEQANQALGFIEDEGMAVTGGVGQWEIWTDDQDGRGQLAETCATAYQIRVYESLLRLRGEARFGDLMERTIFNTLFAAQSPDGRRVRYYAPTEGPREYHPVDTYCCPTNYRRIVSELPEMIYYRRGRGIAVNLYTASRAELTVNQVSLAIAQVTEFPAEGDVLVRIDPARPVAFPLHLRIPSWASGARLMVNGEAATAAAGSFAVIEREWKRGDKVEIRLPMKPRLVLGRRRQAGRAAVLRGPIVYALNPAQNPELAKLDGSDLGRFTLDPAAMEVTSDSTVRPAGTAIRAGAWRPGYGIGLKHDLTLTLTEFPDPGATATYFKLRSLEAAMADELHRGRK